MEKRIEKGIGLFPSMQISLLEVYRSCLGQLPCSWVPFVVIYVSPLRSKHVVREIRFVVSDLKRISLRTREAPHWRFRERIWKIIFQLVIVFLILHNEGNDSCQSHLQQIERLEHDRIHNTDDEKQKPPVENRR